MAPSEKYEVYVSVLTGQATQALAASMRGMGRTDGPGPGRGLACHSCYEGVCPQPCALCGTLDGRCGRAGRARSGRRGEHGDRRPRRDWS